jgi:hypothetical protein
MTLSDRVDAFQKLGNYLNAIDEVELAETLLKVRTENPWFTERSVMLAIKGIAHYLDGQKLKQWVSSYPIDSTDTKKIAVVMAGNIPLAGFHDFLSVLISGHHIVMKLSSKDSVLPSLMAKQLVELEPRLASSVTIAEQLRDFDAVIATGSDNSARYFHYYFGKHPHIIRKNRTSCAVLTGSETDDELQLLGKDIFSYYGLGCRNVSKIFLPQTFDVVKLILAWDSFADIMDHNKYHNNYDYQKSILLVNQIPFYDSGFVILHENEKLVSPISVVYFERYRDAEDLSSKLSRVSEKLQCTVGKTFIPFGQAQLPELWDYADQVDTLKFLSELS